MRWPPKDLPKLTEKLDIYMKRKPREGVDFSHFAWGLQRYFRDQKYPEPRVKNVSGIYSPYSIIKAVTKAIDMNAQDGNTTMVFLNLANIDYYSPSNSSSNHLVLVRGYQRLEVSGAQDQIQLYFSDPKANGEESMQLLASPVDGKFRVDFGTSWKKAPAFSVLDREDRVWVEHRGYEVRGTWIVEFPKK